MIPVNPCPTRGVRATGELRSADAILRETFGDFQISERQLRKAEAIELVRFKREQRSQTLCFNSRPFVLCGLPVRKLPAGQLLYERRNGQFLLQVTGHPNFGVPFGQDRIVPIFPATLAVQQKSQSIRFHSAAEMLETFGMHKGGKEYRRLVAAFERIFGATIFFGTDSMTAKAKVVQRSRFNFLREARIWYDRRPDQRVIGEKFENVIVLSDEFYDEILAHPIPTDLDAVNVLAAAPAALDLFMWLVYRCFLAKGPESIPLFGPCGLTLQLGCTEFSRPSRFRGMLEQWLRTIRCLWPDCPAMISSDGAALKIDQRAAVLPLEARSVHFRG